MPVVVVFEFEAGLHVEAFADAATAYKYAVNELVTATHDSLPTANGEVRELLQRTFTLLSERSVEYAERYRRGRALWRRVRVFAEESAVSLGPRRRSSPLVDVLVLEEASVAELEKVLRFHN